MTAGELDAWAADVAEREAWQLLATALTDVLGDPDLGGSDGTHG